MIESLTREDIAEIWDQIANIRTERLPYDAPVWKNGEVVSALQSARGVRDTEKLLSAMLRCSRGIQETKAANKKKAKK